jgi:hypothetical protein
MAGRVMQEADNQKVPVRWGGNWDRDNEVVTDQKFDDLVHFEITDK